MLTPIPDRCPHCQSKRITLVEYSYDDPNHYDGVSEIQCKRCKKRFGRWSKKELAPGEAEKIYGGNT